MRLAQQFDQPFDRISAVALLAAETLRVDHDYAVLGHALAGKPADSRRDVGSQRDPAGIETQLRRGRELVDVLPARAGGANERNLDLVLVNREIAGNP